MKLTNPSVTSFDATPDTPARVTIGGQDAHGKRVDPYSFTTAEFLESAKTLLKPSLDATLESSHSNLANLLAGLDEAKRIAIEAHQTFAKAERRLFAATVGQVSNQTLPSESNGKATVTVTV